MLAGLPTTSTFTSRLRDLVQRLALNREDFGVGRQQVLALHALRARTRADQQGHVGVLECNFGIVGDHDARQQRERAVVEFHHDAFDGALRLRQFEQLQDHRLVLAEHVAIGDAEQQGVSRFDLRRR